MALASPGTRAPSVRPPSTGGVGARDALAPTVPAPRGPPGGWRLCHDPTPDARPLVRRPPPCRHPAGGRQARRAGRDAPRPRRSRGARPRRLRHHRGRVRALRRGERDRRGHGDAAVGARRRSAPRDPGRQGDPAPVPAGRLPQRGRDGDRGRLPRARSPLRPGGGRRRGARLGHRDRPPRGQLRGAAGDLPQRAQRRRRARRRPRLLRLAVHRPGDQLPHRPRHRPPPHGAVGGGHEDGAQRPGGRRGDVQHRYRDRLRGRRRHQRDVGPRRDGGQGVGEPRRVHGLQAAARSARPAADHRGAHRREAAQADLRRGRHRDHDDEGHHPGRAARPRAQRRRGPAVGAVGRRGRTPLRLPHAPRVGEGRRRGRVLLRPGARRDRAVAARPRHAHLLRPGDAGRGAHRGAGGGRGHHPRPGAGDRERRRHRSLHRRSHPGDGHDRPRLDADPAAGGRDRHRPRRPHLPRGDRQPRARYPLDRRQQRCDPRLARRAGDHPVVRRGRPRRGWPTCRARARR